MKTDINIISKEGKAEIIIREGEAPEVHDPITVSINGTIDAVTRYLRNREIPQEKQHDCFITVNKETGDIVLKIEEHSFFCDTIIAKIEEHPSITNFGINTGEHVLPEKMANHLKMRKHFFESQSEYASVYSALRAFKAKVNQAIEAIKDDRGNFDLKKAQVVEHNIPAGFNIKVPLFKGMDPVVVPVEFIVNSSLDVALSSTDLIQMIDEVRESAIDKQIKEIQEIASGIVVINI